jgi:hypothetical protein
MRTKYGCLKNFALSANTIDDPINHKMYVSDEKIEYYSK